MDLAHIPTLRAHISQFIWIFLLQATYNILFTMLLHSLGKNHYLGGVGSGRQKAAIMGSMLSLLFRHIFLAPLIWGILIQISMGKSGSTPNPTLTAFNPIWPRGGVYIPLFPIISLKTKTKAQFGALCKSKHTSKSRRGNSFIPGGQPLESFRLD